LKDKAKGWQMRRSNDFHLHIPSGQVVAVDPMFIEYAQNPRGGIAPILEQAEYQNAEGSDKLFELEMAAMASKKQRKFLRVIGFVDLRPCSAGVYAFSLEDILNAHDNVTADPTETFSIDSGQVLVFDIRYLDGVLKHFCWEKAYNNNLVNRNLEREHGKLIANRDDVYVQIQSPGIGRDVPFTGDGEYYFRKNAFRLIWAD
jgi:hypothetical protein